MNIFDHPTVPSEDAIRLYLEETTEDVNANSFDLALVDFRPDMPEPTLEDTIYYLDNLSSGNQDVFEMLHF